MLPETAQVNSALSYSLLFYDRILIIKLCLLLVLCVVVVPFKHMHWILISTRGRLDWSWSLILMKKLDEQNEAK